MSELVRLAKEALRQQKALDPIYIVLPGNPIIWRGADGTPRGPATVDFVHISDDGTRWAFCTLPDGGWTAVNTRFVAEIEGDTHGR